MNTQLGFLQKALSCVLIAGATLACSSASAQTTTLVDDFNGTLSGYTQTVILDVNGNATNGTTFQTNANGQLEVVTTNYDDIEQIAFIRDGLSLAVGDEVQLDVTDPLSGNRNLGLYVGGTAPTTGIREDYVSNYGAANGAVATRGFDGSSEYGNTQVFPDHDTLFIALTAPNTFEVGYYDAGIRTVYETRNPATPNSADFVGIYADIRADGTLGVADNLRVVSAVPEPSSLALLGLASIAGLARRRKR